MTRLYLPPPLTIGPQPLAPEREHYLKNVLRIRHDAAVTVFDGTGVCGEAVASRSGRTLSLVVQSVEPAPAIRDARAHLAFALLKGKAMEQVLRKATELGATDLWPLYTDHTQVPRKLLASVQNVHNASILVSACEQCGQNRLPELHAGQSLDALLERPPVEQTLFADLGSAAFPVSAFPATLPRQDTLLVIGPEGGWSERERALARARSAEPVSLGEWVLRAETAPLAALAMLSMAWRSPPR